MTSHPGKSFCLLLFFFCCDLLGENFYPVALSRSQKTTCGNEGSEFPRRRDTEGGCLVRFDYNASGRALAVSRSEEVSVGLPPLIQNLRAATSGQAEQVYGSVGLHLLAPRVGGGVCFESRGASARPECPLVPLSPHSRRLAGRAKQAHTCCLPPFSPGTFQASAM